MSIFGKWVCPICGLEWKGGIDYNDYCRVGDGFNEILEVICGCTNKKLSDEQMEKIISFSRIIETEAKI